MVLSEQLEKGRRWFAEEQLTGLFDADAQMFTCQSDGTSADKFRSRAALLESTYSAKGASLVIMKR
jgi:hypothetical protein